MATELENRLRTILEEKLNKIKPENIKSGVKIFDVEGTLEEGSSIPSTKLFTTEEEMQADPAAKEGDLALVYRSEIQSLTENSVMTGLSFESTVVLDTAITTSGYAYLYDENEDYKTQCQLRYSSTYFYIRDYYSGDYIVRYTSTDGITYTLNSGYDTSYTFEQPMHFSGTWNDIYGQFVQCGGMTFEGLFKNKHYLDKTEIQLQPISALVFTRDDTVTYGIANPKLVSNPLPTTYKLSDLTALYDKLMTSSEVGSSKPSAVTMCIDEDDDLVFIQSYDTSTNTLYNICYFVLAYDNEGKFIGTYDGYMSSHTDYKVYKLDLVNSTYTLKKTLTATKTSGLAYGLSGIMPKTVPVKVSSTYVSNEFNMSIHTTAYEGEGSLRF